MQRRPWRIPSCTGLTTTRPHSECEWKRGDGQPKRPNSRDSGHHGGLDEVAFSWKISLLHDRMWVNIFDHCCRAEPISRHYRAGGLSLGAGAKKGRIQPMTQGTGIVKWYNGDKGFGFIRPDDGSEDLFVHYTGIIGGGRRSLAEGDKVTYEAVQGRRGGMRAENVSKV